MPKTYATAAHQEPQFGLHALLSLSVRIDKTCWVQMPGLSGSTVQSAGARAAFVHACIDSLTQDKSVFPSGQVHAVLSSFPV